MRRKPLERVFERRAAIKVTQTKTRKDRNSYGTIWVRLIMYDYQTSTVVLPDPVTPTSDNKSLERQRASNSKAALVAMTTVQVTSTIQSN